MWKWGYALAVTTMVSGCGSYQTGLLSAPGVIVAATSATDACQLDADVAAGKVGPSGDDYDHVKDVQIRFAGSDFRPISQAEFSSADKDGSGRWNGSEFIDFLNNKSIVEVRYKKCR